MGVRYVPLDPIDFEKREWVPDSGWPISRTDLDPYYERAHKVAQSGPYSYKVEDWQDPNAQSLLLASDRLTTQIFHFGPKDIFTHEYADELRQSANITLMIHAHALELETDDQANVVTGIKVGVLGGRNFQVKARFVVLTQGGLESARLLLLSNAVQSCGLGNTHDLVGRFLMDHPTIRPGVLVPKNRDVVNQLSLYDARWINGARVIAKPILTEETQRKEQLLNINTAIFPRPSWARYNVLRKLFPKGQNLYSPAIKSAQTLKKLLQNRRVPSHSVKHFVNIMTGLDDLIYKTWRIPGKNRFGRMPLFVYDFDHGGWSQLEQQVQKFGCFDLLHVTEQAPDPNNRVTLSADKDPFGYPRLMVNWRCNDIDHRSTKRAMEIFAEEFDRLGFGKLQLELDHGNPAIWSPSIHHSMGTTRMHESPQHGVVDARGQVHGVANLFIASTAFFMLVKRSSSSE